MYSCYLSALCIRTLFIILQQIVIYFQIHYSEYCLNEYTNKCMLYNLLFYFDFKCNKTFTICMYVLRTICHTFIRPLKS